MLRFLLLLTLWTRSSGCNQAPPRRKGAHPGYKGITTVVAVGTAANGAVYTSSSAALRGFNVIVPVDGMSAVGQNPYVEQYVAYNFTSAPVVSPKITLTRIDMIKF